MPQIVFPLWPLVMNRFLEVERIFFLFCPLFTPDVVLSCPYVVMTSLFNLETESYRRNTNIANVAISTNVEGNLSGAVVNQTNSMYRTQNSLILCMFNLQ